MAVSFDFASFLDTLKTALEARGGLAGVAVFTVPPNPDSEPQEGISFDRVRGSLDFLAMGGSYRDDLEIDGRVWAQAPDASGENGTASRNRAVALLDELASELQDTASPVQTLVNCALVTSYDWQSHVVDPAGYRSIITFTVTAIDLDQGG